jgi:hypothetical protein
MKASNEKKNRALGRVLPEKKKQTPLAAKQTEKKPRRHEQGRITTTRRQGVPFQVQL